LPSEWGRGMAPTLRALKLMIGGAAMKTMVALLGSLSLVPMLAGSAMAQTAEENVRVEPPVAQEQQAAPRPQYAAPQPQAMPPAQVAVQAGGEWQYLDGEGWVWVPTGTAAYDVGSEPYAYLYTPSYGWTWYVSPWGWGPYRYGYWVRHPWHPVGWHGRWVAHPRVVVRLGPGRFRR
jgi:hypothetical protein